VEVEVVEGEVSVVVDNRMGIDARQDRNLILVRQPLVWSV